MESIKETDLNLQREKVTSVANTWLVKAVNPSTGEEKMIDVSNFSSVVAGVMGTNKLFPFMYRGYATDADTATKTGIYKCGSDVANTPAAYGELLVYESDGLYTSQIYITFANQGSFYRTRTSSGSAWTAWRRFDNFGYNSLADLMVGMGNPLVNKGEVTNANNIKDTGIYNLYLSTSVNPNDTPKVGYGFTILSIKSSSHNIQMAFGFGVSEIYYRLTNDVNNWVNRQWNTIKLNQQS